MLHRTALGLLALFSLLSVLVPQPGHAQVELYRNDALAVSGGLDIAIAGYQTSNTNFGGGLETPAGRTLKNVGYSEGFARPRLDVDVFLPNQASLYGGVGWVLALTRGDGDPGGASFGRPENVDNELLFVGLRSGSVLPIGPENVVDVSFGRQNFEIGDGFLIADGNIEQNGKAAILMGPRNAFESAALLRINTEPVRADIFHLTSDGDANDPKLYGFNLEWHDDLYGNLGLYGFNIYQASATGEDGKPAFTTRDGLSTLSGRGDLTPLAGVGWPDASLAFEAAWQNNDRKERKLDALGWHVTLGYHFTQWPWQPKLSYRYSHFSGDNPNTPNVNEAFDPLFVAGPGFGTWFQGEIVGQYLITNSNLNVHSIHLTAQPSSMITVGALFFSNRLNHPGAEEAAAEGGTVTAHSFAQELDIYSEIALTENLSFTPLVGIAWPGKAAEQMYGNDKVYGLIEGFISLSF